MQIAKIIAGLAPFAGRRWRSAGVAAAMVDPVTIAMLWYRWPLKARRGAIA